MGIIIHLPPKVQVVVIVHDDRVSNCPNWGQKEAYCSSPSDTWSMLEWYWQGKTEDRRSRRETCPSITYSTANPTWTDLGTNACLRRVACIVAPVICITLERTFRVSKLLHFVVVHAYNLRLAHRVSERTLKLANLLLSRTASRGRLFEQ
jgi:hypothetical protein